MSSEGRLALQRTILVALASSFSFCAPPKLISLTLRNLRTWDLAPLECPAFQVVLKNLRRLQLFMLFDRARDDATAFDRWSYFWSALCYRLILVPTQHALTELTLHPETPFGAMGGLHVHGIHLQNLRVLSFAELYFPSLRVLSLRMLVFKPSAGVETFILRHAATLARLELIMCKLLIPNDEKSGAGPTRWEHIWDNFATRLTALVALHVDDSSVNGSAKNYRYSREKTESIYFEEDVPPHLDVADAAALERLYVTIAARSEEARGAT